ncbi:MAG TPA: beta-ribofuranosylaminobenzene 5'-phosphate synthase family protein [Stellaceae bacterium]|nr:beta-ribofuranosylaminobenzene 5'-phosphate synthase family protein [Stellaceae bacterium]
MAQGPCEAVEVFAPARLHLGFLDLNGGLGRRFGSLGLTIDGIGTLLTVMRDAAAGRHEATPQRAQRMLDALSAGRFAALGPLAVRIEAAIPEHVGLGSGTQLGLAVAAGVAAFAGESVSARALAPLVERGARSGIGIGAFETGGFLVDGGKAADDAPAPIVARAIFPSEWRLVLIFDAEGRGLSSSAEIAAFQALPPFPEAMAAQLCRLTLLRLLPGLGNADFAAVADSIGEIGARLGDYFAPVQGGRYASPRVAAVLEWLRGEGFSGIGQSSWGPTGFVFVADRVEAQELQTTLAQHFGASGALSFRICSGRNRGAEIRRLSATHELAASEAAAR